TISCCEVLNSLIFPAHEQHHNNSFLCAALLMGQSNMAAGATIGSNHNSRSPDGEMVAGRGFWPGLCVSLKHNSKFASFNILAKGDYPSELNIPIPFSLISNEVSKDELLLMPAYWFLHNMYALARNSWKYTTRDRRIDKTQLLEYDYLAPDSVNEMIDSLELFRKFTGKAYMQQFEPGKKYTEDEIRTIGRKLLDGKNPVVDELDIIADGFENSERKVRLVKVSQAYPLFTELISYYAVIQLMGLIKTKKTKTLKALLENLPSKWAVFRWINAGGQLIPENELTKFLQQVHSGKIKGWEQVHQFYKKQGENYPTDKLSHALAALKAVNGINIKKINPGQFKNLFVQAIATREWMTRGIYDSRAKDYSNHFRMMVYENAGEMNAVVGSLEDNSFIKSEIALLKVFKKEMNEIIRKFKL
ncbi:MAG TPA: hypothetical protein VK543_16180, partial [Puia sp.]|nr:hypothetical protein [Puia sp.]